MKPRLFVGSSTEGLNLAYAAQQNLHHSAEVTVWDQGVFQLSITNLESLLECLVTCDFGMFVFSRDDISTIRGQSSPTVRDNVIFELGLFVGVLGRERCFILVPEGTPDLHIPTDLIGMSPAHYETDRSDGSSQAATGPACNQIRGVMQRLRLRPGRAQPKLQKPEAPEGKPAETNAPEQSATHKVLEPDGSESADYGWLDALIEANYGEAARLLALRIATEPDPENRLNLDCWLGRAKYEINPVEGCAHLEALISAHPTEPRPYDALAYAHLRGDRYPEALEVVDRCLGSGVLTASLINARVRCLVALSREAEIEETIKAAISINPQYPELYVELAEHYVSSGQTERAVETLEDGESVIPNSEAILAKYASILGDQTDPSLALIPYRTLIHAHPKNSSYLGLRANIYLNGDLYDLAMRDYRKASALAEDKEAWLLCNIGNALKNKGFFHDAIEYLNRGLAIDPDSEYGHNRLAAAIKSRDEEQEKGKEVYEKAKKALIAARARRKEASKGTPTPGTQ